MRIQIYSIATFLILLVAACSGYNEVLKSDDFEAKREYAKTSYENKQWDRAAALYEQIYQRYSQGPIGEESYFRLGMSHYNMKDYLLAGYYFSNYSTRFFYSPQAEEAKFLSAMCAVKNVPKTSLDQAETHQALNALQEFINLYPMSQLVDSCNRVMDRLNLQLEAKAYENAYIYFHTEHYRAAAAAMDAFVADYPSSKRKEEAMYLATKSSYFLAINSIDKKKIERFEDVIQRCAKFAELFPESKNYSEVLTFKGKAEKVIEESKKV
jgi:outer membrane protein assembly factor BamD